MGQLPQNQSKEIKAEASLFLKWAISSLLDAAFVAFWVVIQWLVGLVINRFRLDGIDEWVLIIFQVAFAVMTLAPIVIYAYTDIRIMIIQAKRRIELEERAI